MGWIPAMNDGSIWAKKKQEVIGSSTIDQWLWGFTTGSGTHGHAVIDSSSSVLYRREAPGIGSPIVTSSTIIFNRA